MPRTLDWRTPAVAFSFANICYLRIWSELLTYTRPDAYTMQSPPAPAAYFAAITNVLLAGSLGWLVAARVRRSSSPRVHFLARCALFVLCLLPLNALRAVLANRYSYLRSPLFELLGTRGVILLGTALGAIALLVLWRWPGKVARAIPAVFLLLSPLVPMTFVQALWRAAHQDGSGFSNLLAPPLNDAARQSPRVLWLVLDEWDQRLTFEDRPAGLALPEIDRWRRQTLYADHAYSPGPETPVSMPALITGHMVEDVAKRDSNRLLLVEPDRKQPVLWRAEPNLFGTARAEGFNTAIVGWYHPYCRVIGDSVNDCSWWPMAMQYNSMGRSFAELVPNQTRSLFETSLLSIFGQSLSTRDHVVTYHEMMAKTFSIIPDRRYGLMLVHLPIPHAPHAYNRRTGRFDLKRAPIKGYIDSLALADLTLKKIRETLESAGLWDATTVLATTDHSYRASEPLDGKKDHRIPFLLKMAGHSEAVEFHSPFNTILTHDLLLSILRGRISDPQTAAAWLDAHRTIADSPYNHN